MKSIIVARVSTEEQKEAGNSLPAQITNMKGYCERGQYPIIKVFSFEESAYKIKRDEFDKVIEYVLDYLKNSKEKLAICFDKVDRLSRNIFDKRVAWLYDKAVKGEIEIHFVNDSQVVNDRMSAGDKFMFEMKLGLSKYYSDATSDNVKRAFEQKRRNGEWTGAVRLGYLNVALDEEKRLRKDIIIDPERGSLIKKMFELYATGNYSLETIRFEVINLGLRTLKGNELSKSGVENILKDSFYCGIALSKKYGSYVHKYPRLINKELFDVCQDIRLKRHKNFSKLREYIFKGLLKCKHCGCSMSPEYHRKASGKEYIIYSCTNSKGICKRYYINEKELLRPVYEVLERFGAITEDVQNDLVEELRKNTEAEVSFNKAQVTRIRSQFDQLKVKKDRLLDAYLEQSITKDIYDKKNQEYSDQLQILNIELQEHTKADYEYQTTVATVISVARRAKEIFESSEISEKRALLNLLLQNPVVDEKKLYFSIASPFNLVLELADNPNWLPG
ncbi:MAG TPA: recombinase family protein [Candidatus Paceibacterota bacterium]